MQQSSGSLKQRLMRTDSEPPRLTLNTTSLEHRPSKITIEDINPELAAQIVHHHILPMFDKRLTMARPTSAAVAGASVFHKKATVH